MGPLSLGKGSEVLFSTACRYEAAVVLRRAVFLWQTVDLDVHFPVSRRRLEMKNVLLEIVSLAVSRAM
jgi:hypothetical protein